MATATRTPALEPAIEADFRFPAGENLQLDGGGWLARPTLRYTVYGDPERLRDDAVLVCHALSGSARPGDWWPGLFGAGGPLDLRRHAVVGVNVIGSCYGSTGPPSIDPDTGAPYGDRFPVVTIGDVVRAERRLADHLGVRRWRSVIGGSIGGMQALRWAVDDPERVASVVAAGVAPLSALGLAFNHLQRRAIRLAQAAGDPAPGLALARAIATCTYKSAALFDARYGREPNRAGDAPLASLDGRYDVAGYLDHQGEVFVERFDAAAYLVLSKAMDSFDLDDVELERIRARVLLVGIASDWLFPAESVRSLAVRMGAGYVELETDHGHDGFLVEERQLGDILRAFLRDLDGARRSADCGG